MAQVQNPPPRLPEAPEQYDPQYMADLLRALEIFISQERTPGEMRGTKLTLTALPSSVITADVNGAVSDSTAVTVDNVQNGTLTVGQIVRATAITGTVKIATVNSQTSIVLDTAVTLSDNDALTISSLEDGALYNDSGTVKVIT